jgi:hypothetical protein
MLTCYYCGTEIVDAQAAADAGWVPDFRRGPDRVDGPVCPACAAARLVVGADGEMKERPEEGGV